MGVSRRELIRQLAAMGVLGAGGAVPALAQAEGERVIPWRNWSGGQVCLPQARVAPSSEQELADIIRGAAGTVRAVGSGHSFSPLVPTDGTIVSLLNMNGMISSDADKLQSEFWAGTRMSEMGEPLKKAGLALPNMSDIDYQTLAGAISTSTHGTGIKYGSYSTQITGMRLITASGDAVDCDAQNHPEIFNAARVSLGALGVVSRVKLQNRKAFRLHRKEWVSKVNELLEKVPDLLKQHDHFEMMALAHSDVAVATATNETSDARTLPKEAGGDMTKLGLLKSVDTWTADRPALEAWLLDHAAPHIPFPEVIDDSYKVFANVRDVRFNEMEYEIPAEAGIACLKEVLETIRSRNLHTFFPIEFRYVKGDDIWMSMFQGRDTCSISVHQYYDLSYQDYFSQVEQVFLKYDGRPHWGKLHNLNHHQLSKKYPHMKDFLEVRQSLDPKGKFLNDHLRSIFGLAGSCA